MQLNGKHIAKAKRTKTKPIKIPSTLNSIFTAINQAMPSRLNENINPGNLTSPHENTVKNTSSMKLFFKNKQDIKVKVNIGRIMVIASPTLL